nr:hypothetical protein [uncultured Flavobacterium sp.]
MFFHSFIYRKKSILLLFFISVSSFSQQIGDGFASILPDFTIPNKSGMYNGLNPIGGISDNTYSGWQHLILVRHPNPNNDHQLQIASSFTTNDRLFFRKLAGGLNTKNPDWIEIATRGSNVFSGDQIVNGNQSVKSNLVLGRDADMSMISGPSSSGAIQIKSHSGLGGPVNRYLRIGWQDNNSVFYPAVSVNEDLNVGIGTTTPGHKLDVIGTIRSREVKVDMNGADFVFEEKYPLMPLSELETYIKKNKHLPEIAPAKEMQEQGSNLGDLNTKLLQKIEELTLYTIEQNKRLELQNKKLLLQNEKIDRLEQKLTVLETKKNSSNK